LQQMDGSNQVIGMTDPWIAWAEVDGLAYRPPAYGGGTVYRSGNLYRNTTVVAPGYGYGGVAAGAAVGAAAGVAVGAAAGAAAASSYPSCYYPPYYCYPPPYYQAPAW